jgi:hypothetical protein
MSQIRIHNILRIMIASGSTPALPVGADWPVHKALVWLGTEAKRHRSTIAELISSYPDPDAGLAVAGVTGGLASLVDEGFLVLDGNGYTARWRVSEPAAAAARRDLMREDLQAARLLTQAGQRLATWASTALKNADIAAASWASTVSGPAPVVRQSPVLALL